ncbi:DNA cytosine methyltransferase [Vibrio cyclitrophicus]
MKYIELFSGCGGLSLGLESLNADGVRMDLVMANELSPMPANTFAFNILKEDIEDTGRKPSKVKWLSSNYPVSELSNRLSENPLTYPQLNKAFDDSIGTAFSDIENAESLYKKLIVANVVQLNELFDTKENLLSEFFSLLGGVGSLDFISGGPPCQSFSMAGLRKKDDHKNKLPLEFANFVDKFKPKLVLLENVTGILRAFQEEGKRYYAWVEVAKAFASIGYIPLCLHVNAKYAGAPQNRPRFIMIGVRFDIYAQLKPRLNPQEKKLFSSAENFYASTDKSVGILECHDVKNEFDLFKSSFLSHLVDYPEDKVQISVRQAIDDLRYFKDGIEANPYYSKDRRSDYVKDNEKTLTGCSDRPDVIYNQVYRNNKSLVQQRFRLYQVLKEINCRYPHVAREVRAALKSEVMTAIVLSNEAWKVLNKKRFLIDESFSGEPIWKSGNELSKGEFEELLKKWRTKKQTQKALDAEKPAGTALSIPDDICHYHQNELRTLTVREMARIQSFPDKFIFRSKITTGGQMRKFEVPQYTQVGNAVPPVLGRALGLCLRDLLSKLS